MDLNSTREALRGVQTQLESQSEVLQHLAAEHRAAGWQRRKLIATLPVAAMDTDPDGRIVWANSAAAMLFRSTLVRLLRMPLEHLVHEDDRPAVQAYDSETPEEEIKSVRVRVLPLDSEPVKCDLRPTEMLDELGSEHLTTWIFVPTVESWLAHSTGIDSDTIASVFSRISQVPLRSHSHQDALSAVADLCDDALIPGSSVSVSMGAPLKPEALASSTKLAQAADGAQFAAQEGPAQTAWETGEVVLVRDLESDERWPTFARTSSAIGVSSVLVAPVRIGEQTIGVLSIYNQKKNMFVNPAPHLVQLLAEAVGAAIHHITEEKRLRDVADQLEEAMASRATIEQAKGIVMMRQGCSADEAFQHLAVQSQRTNIKLRDLAAALVDEAAHGRMTQTAAHDRMTQTSTQPGSVSPPIGASTSPL